MRTAITKQHHEALVTRLDLRGASTLSERLLVLLTMGYAGAVVAGSSFGTLALGSLAKLVALPFVGLTILVYRHRREARTNSVIYCLGGITILAVMSYFWTIDTSATVTKASTFLQLFAATASVGFALRHLGRRGLIALSWGLMLGAVTAAFMVFYSEIHHTFVNAANYEYLIERVTAGSSDPNDIALSMVLAVPVFLVQRSWIVKLLTLPVGIAVLLTGSRGAILAAVVMLLSFVFLSFSGGEGRQGRTIRPWHVLASAVLVVVVGSIFLPATIIARFKSIPTELTGGTLTNRTILWKNAWNGILNRPLDGYGIGSSPTYEFAHSGYMLVTHNVWLAFFLEIGIVGVLLFLVAFAVAFVGSYKVRNHIQWLFPSMIALFTGTYALAWDYNKLMWLLLVTGGYAAAEYQNVRRQFMPLPPQIEPTPPLDEIGSSAHRTSPRRMNAGNDS